MLLLSLVLGLFGLLASACFAGGETAFYRAAKLRLKLDALGNDRRAKTLFWFANNPGMFVVTILVGNNLCHYIVSAASVVFAGCIIPNADDGILVEIGATLILTPVLFVYGEMFPKNLCLQAPTRMLQMLAPVIILAFRLFLPVTIFLWLFNRFLSLFLHSANNLISLSLGRQELGGILDEGTKTGVLVDTQRRLADGIFQCSNRYIKDIAVPLSGLPFITADMKPEHVLNIARQRNMTELPVYESGTFYPTSDLPIGFVRTIDLETAVRRLIDEQSRQLLQLLQTDLPVRSAVEIAGKYSFLTGLILLQTMHCAFGCVIDSRRRCIGFVNSDRICNALLHGSSRTN
jgi:CBS domain containing-hemolysin-like protein